MVAIKDKNTLPELAVRRLVRALGFRYSAHSRTLPGKPDLIFQSQKAVIFVHGCFWHQHKAKRCGARPPKSKTSYWLPKLARTQQRDRRNVRDLKRLGWRVLVVWECETRNLRVVRRRILKFLRPTNSQ